MDTIFKPMEDNLLFLAFLKRRKFKPTFCKIRSDLIFKRLQFIPHFHVPLLYWIRLRKKLHTTEKELHDTFNSFKSKLPCLMSIILSGLHLTHAIVGTVDKPLTETTMTCSQHPNPGVCVQNSRDNLISSTSGGSQFKSAILHQSRQISSLCLLEEEQILLNSRGTFLKYQKITNFFKASKVKNCNPLHAINAVLGIIRSKLWTSLLLYDLQQHHYCQGPSIPLYSSMLYYVLSQGGLKGGPRQPRPPIFGGK